MHALSANPSGVTPAHPFETPWWVSAALTLTVMAYAISWMSFPPTWLASRSHGFAVAVLCVWLIWRDRDMLRRPHAPYHPARLTLLGLSLTWFVGVVISAQVVHQSTVPLLLLSWLLAVYGKPAARAAAPIAAAFSLALPVWEVLIWPLQQMTVFVNSLALTAVGLEATIRGESITIPSGTLVVAESCAGLNFLVTGLTVSVAYSLLFVERWTSRARLIASAAIISLVANWVRVFGLVVIAHATKMKSPLMQDHSMYGWMIFAIALVVFFWFAPRIERGDGGLDPARVSHSADHPEATKISRVTAAAVLAATSAAVVGPALFLLISAIPVSTTTAAPFSGLAPTIDWRPAPAASTAPWTPAQRGASEIRILQTGAGVDAVQLNHLIYRSRGQGAELISDGNPIASDSVLLEDRYVGPLDGKARLVRQAVIRQPRGLRLVWYWYRVAHVETPSRVRAKLLELPAFVLRTPSSELLTVSTPCSETECAAATQRLYRVTTGREMPVARAR